MKTAKKEVVKENIKLILFVKEICRSLTHLFLYYSNDYDLFHHYSYEALQTILIVFINK